MNAVLAELPMPGRAAHMIERNLHVYRRTWIVIVSGFFEPVFYLLGIGLGIGALVGGVRLDDGRTVPYAVFVAPALMASAAMNGAIYESTFNLFFKLTYTKLFETVLATPMSTRDIAVGEVSWALIRGSLYSIAFLLVMAVLGDAPSPWTPLALPACSLIGFSFAAVGTAATTFMRKWQDFDLVMLVLIPFFLFSGTFFPVSAYPGALRWLVEAAPLYRGVHLVRALTTGTIEPLIALDVGYLAVLGGAGVLVTRARLDRLLRR